MTNDVYSIGHSTHSLDKFLALLEAHNVTAIADVRSQPFSRFNPQYNQKTLQSALSAAGIAYVFLGRELGARTEDPGCYVGGKVQYDLLSRTPAFLAGIQRVINGSAQYRIALMCAEKDPLTCHRTILVSRHIVARSVGVNHILATGALESHEDSINRLLAEVGLHEPELFINRDTLVAQAYSRRAEQIAYQQEPSSSRGSAPAKAR